MILIFAKFVAKRTDGNAQHVKFICAQIACTSILVILMSFSGHLFFFFKMSHACLMWQVYNALSPQRTSVWDHNSVWECAMIQCCFCHVHMCFPSGGWILGW